MKSLTVSVIVPLFNGERLIGEAIGSLRQERDVELEIVVVDDGSTDNSIRVVEALSDHDPRIRLITSEHRGVSSARNIGVRAATADYVTFLDSDDICPPGRIGRQLRKLLSNSEAAGVVGETMFFEALTQDLKPAPDTRHVRVLCATLHSALFPRPIFDTYGMFDETLAFGEDLDFFFRLLESDALLLVEDEIASLYRRHDGNMTRNLHGVRNGMLAALHRSIVRRRLAKRDRPLDNLFMRRILIDSTFDTPALKATSSR